ncbi:unnamed protein product [Alternaria alternata]
MPSPITIAQPAPPTQPHKAHPRQLKQATRKNQGTQMRSDPSSMPVEFVNHDRLGLLAAKSNYECVAEGRHTKLGLRFPDSMVASIASKRTTHSASEKRQRDRLKSAFEDLAEVLFSGNAATTTNGNSVLLYQDDQSKLADGTLGDLKDGGRKFNVSRVRLIELAVERIKGQRSQTGRKGQG